MTYVYLFDKDGNCFNKTRFDNDSLVDAFIEKSGKPASIKSTDDVPFECAKLVGGLLKNVSVVVTIEKKWLEVLDKRNGLLRESDWTDTVSASTRLGATNYQKWQTYRQALRDITTQTDPFNIQWPIAP